MHMHAYGDTHIAHNKFSYTPQQQSVEGLDMKEDRPTGGFVVWRFHPSCVTFSSIAHTHKNIYKALNFWDEAHTACYVCVSVLFYTRESPSLIGLSQLFVYFSILHPRYQIIMALMLKTPSAGKSYTKGNNSLISNAINS